MASNFGKTIQVSTFGASHGYAIGGIVEGLPLWTHHRYR